VNEVRKTALVAYPVEGMFDLIEAAEHYPAFLPWCGGATILSRDDAEVRARITIDYHGARFHFVTRNPKRRPGFMAITLEEGPFRHFGGEWHLTRLSAEACKIEFLLRYEFQSTVMGKLAGPVFDRIANTLVDAFVARAGKVLASSPASPPAGAAAAVPPVAIPPVAAPPVVATTVVAPAVVATPVDVPGATAAPPAVAPAPTATPAAIAAPAPDLPAALSAPPATNPSPVPNPQE
jgi:ribosome-associated toxin RatA of RatAB toxin-antitoxin module